MLRAVWLAPRTFCEAIRKPSCPWNKAFAYRDGGYDLWAVAPDGSGQHQLTWGASDDRDPVFCHDGTRIAFDSDRGNPLGSDYNIFVLDLRDGKIRQLTNNQHSLDDFCHAFHGGQSGPPMVVPSNFNDIVKALNAVAPYDWAALLNERVNSVQPRAPLGGIEQGGYRLVYNDTPNEMLKALDGVAKMGNFTYSLGFFVSQEMGTLGDVIVGSPAFKAGIGPGMKLIAVNGRKYSSSKLNAALVASHTLRSIAWASTSAAIAPRMASGGPARRPVESAKTVSPSNGV